MLLKEIKTLFYKDFRLELKQKYVLNGILLYLLSTIFVTYLAFDKVIGIDTWNSLFWIILLFVAVNGISKSFVQESPARNIYYYTITSPQAIVLSKILYNLLLMAILSLLSFGMFVLLMGNMVVNIGLFIVALLLGSFGLASILTMMAAIASRASNNFSLMAILSFPLVLPLAYHPYENFQPGPHLAAMDRYFREPHHPTYHQSGSHHPRIFIISVSLAGLN